MKNTKKAKEFFAMTFGMILMAAGVYFFKIPNGFSTGGVSGIGTLMGKITPLSPALWIWGLNIVLLIVGFIFFGKGTGIKTVYCSMGFSGFTYLFERLFPLDHPLTDQPFMELVYAMLLTSIGSALIFNADASTGGTDIVALLIKKFSKIDVGKALLCSDCVVAMASFFIFDVKIGLFSMLGLFTKAFLVDSIIENLNTCKYFIVITSNPEEITEYIMKELHHGVTTHKVIGEYTKEEKFMIHTVCKRIEAVRLREKIKQIDKSAFTIITTSNDIIGRGFRSV